MVGASPWTCSNNHTDYLVRLPSRHLCIGEWGNQLAQKYSYQCVKNLEFLEFEGKLSMRIDPVTALVRAKIIKP
jgi:hypothetical protein